MKVSKHEITLQMDFEVDELSPAQLAAYEKVASEHNAIKNALKTALNSNEGKELFNGAVFQAYSFKGKVLQEIKEATLPVKKAAKPTEAAAGAKSTTTTRGGGVRKRASNLVYLQSSDDDDDEGEDDVPLAKRIATGGKSQRLQAAAAAASSPTSTTKGATNKKGSDANASKSAVTTTSFGGKGAKTAAKASASAANNSLGAVETADSPPNTPFRPSELTAVGGLVVGNENKDAKDAKTTENKEIKLQGKTFPSLVVLAKPWLKVKDMSATRSKLDSKVKLVLMLTPNKFTEWLIQEGLLKAEQRCVTHRTTDLKLGVYSDATKFPYTGGYVWISECCPFRFVSVFHGSIFEGAPHPPSCILKLIYHWSCQTNIQNVVQWVKVDNVYIKGVYTWLRAICTLAVHQKLKKLGGPERFVEVGVISLGTTSQDGQQRQVKVEVLGVLDYTEKTIRLRAVEPLSDSDRNYKKRFQTILEPLTRWVHKDSVICIDLTVDKMTLNAMGFKNIVQAAATDTSAKHNNYAVMDYLRRIVPRMFQNTLSLLSRQMIQQFLDELVWREQFGTYALQAFNHIVAHIAEQTRMNTSETLTQRLYQVATNPFKDWSVLPANYKEIPANTTPKRLKKPINEADYVKQMTSKEKSAADKTTGKNAKKETKAVSPPTVAIGRGGRGRRAVSPTPTPAVIEKSTTKANLQGKATKGATPSAKTANQTKAATVGSAKKTAAAAIELKTIKKERDDDDLKGLEQIYYGIRDGYNVNFESFPYLPSGANKQAAADAATIVDCPVCDEIISFDSNEKLQTHLVSHISPDGKEHQFQCLFCLEKHASEQVLNKHNQMMHPIETKLASSPSYHCLICQQRFNSLQQLTTHLQKMHTQLELPYNCQACNYRSSSHRDVVRHFYDDHKNQNFLQCPFCLDIFRFAYKGVVKTENILIYYAHLGQHIDKNSTQYRCQKCALNFLSKGAIKQHCAHHHISLSKVSNTVRILLNNSLFIMPPKLTRSLTKETLPYITATKLGEYFAFVDGSFCAECNAEILSEEHYPCVMKCQKCNFKSCCERAIFAHTADCFGNHGLNIGMELPLPNEMHCICGFSTAIGNKMAHHLATCGQKSAYATVEMALENTVKKNMLDMLGLMRRDGESGIDGDDIVEALDEQQQQQSPMDADVDAEQAPIEFGVNEAAPIDGDDDERNEQTSLGVIMSATGAPYHIISETAELQQHGLGAADIDMPLIGDLADPNTPQTPQFLTDVHTPMFDAVAAAEQQDYSDIAD